MPHIIRQTKFLLAGGTDEDTIILTWTSEPGTYKGRVYDSHVHKVGAKYSTGKTYIRARRFTGELAYDRARNLYEETRFDILTDIDPDTGLFRYDADGMIPHPFEFATDTSLNT